MNPFASQGVEHAQMAFGLEKSAKVETKGLPHQQRVVEKLKDPNQRGIIAAHVLGSGKCVRGSTLVLTDAGVMPIEDLFAKQERPSEGDAILPPLTHRVLSLVGSRYVWSQLRARYCQKIAETTTIVRAKSGIELEGTAAHPLHVVRDGALTWVAIRDLRIGDFLAAPERTLPGLVDNVSPDLVDLLTWQITEGWESAKEATTTITQQDVAILLHLQQCFRRLLPDDTSGYIKTPEKHASYLTISSKKYKGLLEKSGYVWGHKSATKKLPSWFLRLPDSQLRQGLRNMFDAEGSVDNYVEFPSASPYLVKQVQYALLRFGIRSSIRSKLGMATNGLRIMRRYYRLFIMGADAARFYTEIGFSYPYKQAALRIIADQKRNTNHGVPVAWLHDTLRMFSLTSNHLNFSKNTGRTITLESAREAVRRLEWLASAEAEGHYVSCVQRQSGVAQAFSQRTLNGLRAGKVTLLDAARRLTALVNAPVRYYEITELVPGETGGYVYDLEVDSDVYEHKNYVGGTGGVILHNTLTSLLAADALGGKADVVVPAALQGNYSKEIRKHAPGNQKNLHIQSLENVARKGGKSLQNPFLIVDEAHRTRNPTKTQSALMESPATKRLLLTGSPLYNRPSDLAGPINLVAGKGTLPANPTDFDREYVEEGRTNPGLLARLFKGERPTPFTRLRPDKRGGLETILRKYIDHYPGSTEGFPTKHEEVIKVPLTSNQRDLYDTVLNKAPPWVRWKIRNGLPPKKREAAQLNTFLSGTRQIANTTAPFQTSEPHDSPKIDKAVEELQKHLAANPRGKAVVYSNYLGAGINPYKAHLDRLKIPYGEFTGEMPHRQRDQLVRDYNHDKLKALLLSSAGGEGLDLKNTSLMQLIEPGWNAERSNQVIGRGVRYQSHASLPENQRNVQIQRYLATLPRHGALEKLHLRDPGASVDEYLHNLSAGKEKLLQQFRELYANPS